MREAIGDATPTSSLESGDGMSPAHILVEHQDGVLSSDSLGLASCGSKRTESALRNHLTRYSKAGLCYFASEKRLFEVRIRSGSTARMVLVVGLCALQVRYRGQHVSGLDMADMMLQPEQQTRQTDEGTSAIPT